MRRCNWESRWPRCEEIRRSVQKSVQPDEAFDNGHDKSDSDHRDADASEYEKDTNGRERGFFIHRRETLEPSEICGLPEISLIFREPISRNRPEES